MKRYLLGARHVNDQKSHASPHFHSVAISHTLLSHPLNGHGDNFLMFQTMIPYES